MRRNSFYFPLFALICSVVVAPAGADVKAGVDAWTRGDDAAAVREWQGPAASGDADAQFNLGQAYKLGRGVKQSLSRAEQLFGQAAAQGHLQASDNFGLLLFQRGERARAMPYVTAAAERGDPRAQYLLGVAHFNGDGVPKDWVRAYALTSLAQQAGLAQATQAMTQMDSFIPIDQRQQGVALAANLSEQATATRSRQLAAVDLGSQAPGAAVSLPARGSVQIEPPARRQPTETTIASAEEAVAAAARATGTDTPRTAGADYARPAVAATAPPAVSNPTPPRTPPRPLPPPRLAERPVPASVSPSAPAASTANGPWRIQLGAFGVRTNADALWARVQGRPELSGHGKLLVPAGAVIKLQARGFESQGTAQAACDRLRGGGFGCIVARN